MEFNMDDRTEGGRPLVEVQESQGQRVLRVRSDLLVRKAIRDQRALPALPEVRAIQVLQAPSAFKARKAHRAKLMRKARLARLARKARGS